MRSELPGVAEILGSPNKQKPHNWGLLWLILPDLSSHPPHQWSISSQTAHHLAQYPEAFPAHVHVNHNKDLQY